ncbi:MAG: 16S rRNA (cytosine(967)-C(5))-methyltransferase RsmB [Lactobacillales bacterium]|jgi:16S rRNA (cytosine967-C5)-methyltransferase|nr:16S rRNA (cytosine(967)-C(5))-methyltransferase RsmB [Lactobacillales bacterium]
MNLKKIPQKLWNNPRFLALQTLERVEKGSAYSNLLLHEQLKKSNLSSLDKGLYTEIVYGTIARKVTLNYFLRTFIKEGQKVDLWVQILLQLSLYQWLYLEKVPDYAVFDNSVELAKTFGNPGIARFVNAILRNVQRQGVPKIEEIEDEMERLSVEVSIPYSLMKFLIEQDGVKESRKLGFSLLNKPFASARIDTNEISLSEALLILQEEGIKARKSLISPCGVVAKKGIFAKSSLFYSGKLMIQDESSQLVAPSLQIKAHYQVLDACAAPGGKTAHIASFLEADKGGKVFALDIHPHKIKLIEDHARRMKVQEVVETRVLDARKASEVFSDESFDRVLVDAPCSGLGLMRRRPDIKYTKKVANFNRLKEVQLSILESVCSLVKKKGIIVYSTCTIVKLENEEVIYEFLHRHSEFEKISAYHTAEVDASLKDKMLQIYPQQYGADGFFISCLRKR